MKISDFSREALWPTPADKRQFAEGFKEFMPEIYADWMALAAAQEAGRLDEYDEARKSWKAAAPRPQDFA